MCRFPWDWGVRCDIFPGFTGRLEDLKGLEAQHSTGHLACARPVTLVVVTENHSSSGEARHTKYVMLPKTWSLPSDAKKVENGALWTFYR